MPSKADLKLPHHELRQDDASLQREIEEGQKQKNQSEWQKIERMMIKKQKNDDEQQESRVHQLMTINNNLNLVIDQSVIADIEKSGYPKAYITTSLQSDDLNYVTAFYYLLCTVKEY